MEENKRMIFTVSSFILLDGSGNRTSTSDSEADAETQKGVPGLRLTF